MIRIAVYFGFPFKKTYYIKQQNSTPSPLPYVNVWKSFLFEFIKQKWSELTAIDVWTLVNLNEFLSDPETYDGFIIAILNVLLTRLVWLSIQK